MDNGKLNEIQEIFLKLSDQEYKEFHEILFKLNLNIEDIKRPSNRNQSLSFAEFQNIQHKKINKTFDVVPNLWQEILRHFGKVDQNIDLDHAFNYRTQFKQKNPNEIALLNPDLEEIEIWTDAIV